MQTPAFLLCSERCGSNLICTLLNAHSKVHAPMPLHLGLDFWDSIYRYGSLDQEANWRMLVGHVLDTVEKMPASQLEFDLEEVLAEVEQGSFKQLLELIYTKAVSRVGKQMLFLKDNHLHRQLFYLLRFWPDAKFVFQTRDPRDYVLSCKSVSDVYVHYGSVDRAIEVWREDQERALEALFALPPGQVFVQTYEDLVGDPERVLTALCEFLDLDFEPTMLEFHKTRSAQAAAKALPAYWGNLSKPLNSKNSGKYRSGLSAIEIREVEDRLGDLMVRFGYQLDYPEPSSIIKLGLSLRRIGLSPKKLLAESRYRKGLASAWLPFALRLEYDEALTRVDSSVRYPYR